MLVLTRKPGESIEFPELEITVHFLQVLGMNSMKIGVEAPRDINIIRSEVKPLLPVVEKPTTSIGQVSPDGLVNAFNNAVASAIDECCDDDLPDPEYMLPMQKVSYYANESRRKKKNADYED